MFINNPFKMNDWKFSKFLALIISIQLSFIGLSLLDTIGINIPLLRQVFGFVFLTFVPGYLMLRVLRIHNISSVKSLLYAVGLSLSLIMFLGFFLNIIYPIVGIHEPLSPFNLIISINLLVIALSILSYMIDKNFSEKCYIELKSFPRESFIILLPLIAVIGTYLVNYYDNNIALVVLILLIGLIVILVSLGKINQKFYPLTIFAIALSVVYSIELISGNITGNDVNVEYYFANLVNLNSIWSFQTFGDVNSVLSIVMLVPIYSKIINLNITWIFKIIFPFFYSLIPVGLYIVYKKQSTAIIAFLSCFVFVAFFKFYSAYLGRLGLAELFLTLFLLLMIEDKLSNSKISILFIIFGASIILSHYGLSYLFVLGLLAMLIILPLYKKLDKSDYKFKTVTFTLFLFITIFTLAWYMYISSSSSFIAFVDIGNNMYQTFFTEFFDQNSSQSLRLINSLNPSFLHTIGKYIQLLIPLFIVIGFLYTLKHRLKFKEEYLILSLFFLVVLILSFFIPYLASALNTDRLYQLSLIFLAPFSIIGGIFLINLISRFKKLNKYFTKEKSLHLMSIFLIIFFFFNVGLVYEIFNDQPSSLALSQKSIINQDTKYKAAFYSTFYKEEDINSAEWLSLNRKNSLRVYADFFNVKHILRSYGMMPYQKVITNQTQIQNSYLYLGSTNILQNIAYVNGNYYYNMSYLNPQIEESNLIYSNGESEVLYLKQTQSNVSFVENPY
ncbi:DUF2206 domain-containing protein [Methanobacterium spitsbergense]|uniref:DUF2206 domain-containing protein n=1 Tax=Methanobacterium spitsbergense TaxID=2874285 RepID=A0A8T5V367_9EURY|nr:DUF2206 domain-containing protein [Methanobacterium spitsbergense]MBZ2166311.1 DUF2206 domain-containing protein [Methanobacterium spitsbergense]